ncbi:MAG: hypothetical protein HY426_02440 [Candidatus Levybacteria bacterium]|nr:hypothetical protein [Candidatus Levybacteria bacterium]
MFKRLLEDTNCTIPVEDAAGNIIDHVTTINCVPYIVGNVIFWLLLLAGIVALVLIIISGFKFVTSGGDPKQAEGARRTLTYAIIGLVVVLLSFAVISFIEEVTGLDKNCITRFGFSQCVPEDISQPCSNDNHGGFCSGEKVCAPNDSGSHWTCRFPCSNDHRSGWCPGNQECKRSILPDLETRYWGCK